MKLKPLLSLKWPLIFALSLSALSLGAVSCAHKNVEVRAQDTRHQIVPLVGTHKVHRFNFDNGLRLIVLEDHSSPTFAYQTWYKVGSRNEVPGYTGLAHLFEHMMFKETKNLKDGEFDRILEKNGAEGENAFTSRDYTAYIQELPKDKLDFITKLESDRMINLVVDQKAFKTETEVVQNERRFRNENSPDGLMYQEIFGLAFTQHPYRWPVIGSQEDLERMNGPDAEKFYKSYYSPNHATILVIGDVDPEEVYSRVEKYYGDIPKQTEPVTQITQEPAQTSARRKTLKLNLQVEKILVGYHIPEITHADIPAINVLQTILTGGKSSRLYRALVSTGISSMADSYDLEDKDPSLFIILSNLQKGKKATQAETVILKEIERLAKQPVSDKELSRAKNRLSFSFFESLDSNYQKAAFLGRYETLTGSFERGLEINERSQKVTSAEVQAAAKKYLMPANRSVILGVPK